MTAHSLWLLLLSLWLLSLMSISSYTLLLARCVKSKYGSRPIFQGMSERRFLLGAGVKHLENHKRRRKIGNLKMWMSTKPYSKLFFNMVQNNILSTFQIIAKVYDYHIRPKCPEKLLQRKFADNGKPGNVNIDKTILQTSQWGSLRLSKYISNHWANISWSYPPIMF